jgi:hypothetical protein
MENGKWEVKSEKWKVENGELGIENGNEVSPAHTLKKYVPGRMENRHCDFSHSQNKYE